MDTATADDVALITVIVAARLLLPLLLPLVPLPAIIACLVVDAVDQTLFQTYLSPQTWAAVENGYQGYDKSLDIFYLAMAYVATMRNWTNLVAFSVGQFLWYYRLVGVTLFEYLHDASDPSSWRWLLLVFPNVFEYFFIAYEVVRLRWDPRRMARRVVIGMAAFIWIFIKLPQEWWIHVAQLDFTDFADEHAWVYPTIALLVVAAVPTIWWLSRNVLPGKDWTLHVLADRPPKVVAARGRLFGWPLLEKVMLIGLIMVIFVQILPGASPRPTQIVLVTAFYVTVDSAYSLLVGLRARSMGTSILLFAGLVAVNLGVAETLYLVSGRFQIEHALFFALLLSLIVTWYDRYRPVLDIRRAEQVATP